MLPLLALLLPLIPLSSAALQGSISLWSDSSCDPGATPNFNERDPVALNYTLSADVCGNPGATAHSYIVNSRPTCANGTVAAFAFYSTPNCVLPAEGYNAYNQFNPSKIIDGVCLALVQFSSVAFICDGISNSSVSGSASVVASSPTAVIASSLRLASATPVPPGAKVTVPLYPTAALDAEVMPTGVIPSGTGASAGPSSTFFVSPPDPFTGAAVKLGVPVVGIVAIFGAKLVL